MGITGLDEITQSGFPKRRPTRQARSFSAMASSQPNRQQRRIAELEAQLAEAQETLRAIRNDEVDALVVERPEGAQVFTLQGAETTYRLLVEEMNEGALLLGPDGTVLYGNARFAELAGVALERVMGASWETFFGVEEQPRLRDLLGAANAGCARGDLDLGQGSVGRPVSLLVCSMQRAQVPGFSVVVTDLTERKAAEAALVEANEKLERRVHERTAQLTRSNELLLAEMSERKRTEEELRQQGERLEQLNRILKAHNDCSRALLAAEDQDAYLEGVCRILADHCHHAMVWVGFAEQDEGKSVRPVAAAGFEQGYLETLRLTWADTERGQGPTGTAIRTGRPDGCPSFRTDPRMAPWREEALRRGYGSSLGLPLATEDQVFGAITIYSQVPDAFSVQEIELLARLGADVAQGITTLRLREAHRRAEQALQESEARLEQLVAERTAKLEEMVNELQHMSYAIVHDMRAPLRAVQGFAELMEEACAGCDRDEARDYRQRIRAATKRIDLQITDALQYTRAVLLTVRMAPVDLGKLISELIESYPNLQPHKADIRLEGEFPIVQGNESLLTQGFSNLLDNAVKFVAPGVRPQVRLWAERPTQTTSDPAAAAAGSLVRIWIEDNGIGIPKSCQPRLFRMFQRLAHGYEGTGIGLAIVRKVVERMGGTVGVESEEGQGSRFWVELKAIDA
jgi:PAS domain S-box-containing protein